MRVTAIVFVILCLVAGAVDAAPSVSKIKTQQLIHDSLAAYTPDFSGAMTNAKVYGDVEVFGHLATLNEAMNWDTSALVCPNATSQLAIQLPAAIVANANAADTASFLHPSTVYFPNGFGGYKLWTVVSMNSGTVNIENAIVRASNDGGVTWVIPNSTPDPLFDSALCTVNRGGGDQVASYLSDPFIWGGADGRLYVGTRAVYSYSSMKILWVRSTADGSTWSTQKIMLEANYVEFMSPTIWVDTNGSYTMLMVAAGGDGHSRIVRITSAYADSGWSYSAPDTVEQAGATGTYTFLPTGASTATIADDTMGNGGAYGYSAGHGWYPWHIGHVDVGAGQKLILITAKDSARAGAYAVGGFVLFLGSTFDGGKTIGFTNTPLLRPTGTSTIDSTVIYKAAGWVEHQGNTSVIKLMYSCGRNIASVTNKRGGWRTALTTLSMPYDSSQLGSNSVGSSEIIDGTIALADLSATAVDSTKIPAAGLSTTDMNWPLSYLTNWQVAQSKTTDNDSMVLHWIVTEGTGTSRRDYLWHDSTWNGTDTGFVSCILDFNDSFDADSIAFYYLTNGKIDSFAVYSNAAASAGQPLCDSLYTNSPTDRTSTTLARIAVVLNKNFVKGDRIRVDFVDVLADDNDRTKVARIELVGRKL